jgi:hypothetical protein
MSTNIKRAPVETPAERAEPWTHIETRGEHGGQQDSMTIRRLILEGICVVAALVATVVIYVFFLIYPFELTPRNLMLIFERTLRIFRFPVGVDTLVIHSSRLCD